jgi:hypothetical protein
MKQIARLAVLALLMNESHQIKQQLKETEIPPSTAAKKESKEAADPSNNIAKKPEDKEEIKSASNSKAKRTSRSK